MVAMPQPPDTARWQKSSRSGSGACAEVSCDHHYVWVRNTRSRRLVLSFTRDAWAGFIVGVRRHEFESAS
ncbi:MAG: DUF397 domain-containing protein [Pseudonocardiaceae bacterium]